MTESTAARPGSAPSAELSTAARSGSAPSGELRIAAIDLGSSSGRVMLATYDGARLTLREVYRFANAPLRAADGSHRWDLPGLVAQVRHGLALAGAGGPIASVAVDGWGVDYALLGHDGQLWAAPHAYRDPRTGRHREAFERIAPRAETFARTGVEQALINTSIQLFADLAEDRDVERRVAKVMLLPDLVNRMLGAPEVSGQTIASTTSLADAGAATWARDLMVALGLRPDWFAPIVPERQQIGKLSREVAQVCGVNRAAISLAGTHDTAAAVQAISGIDDGESAFLSCGSWSLLGVCADRPLLGGGALIGGLTNEVGTAGQALVMKNLTGLWLVQQCQRAWRAQGVSGDIEDLVARAASAPAGVAQLRLADGGLADEGEVGGIPAAVARQIVAAGSIGPGVDPSDPGLIVRVILESLAASYAESVTVLEQATGKSIRTIRMVGGGVRNALLCELVATATGRDVVAGHPEATALGNAIGQLIALGEIEPADAGAVAQTAV